MIYGLKNNNFMEKITNLLASFLYPLGMSFDLSDHSSEGNHESERYWYHIEFDTLKLPENLNRGDLDGMAINMFSPDGKKFNIELIEFMAGRNEDELHIKKEGKTLLPVLKSLVKYGNKKKPIKIWN